MNTHTARAFLVGVLVLGLASGAAAGDPPHPLMTWVKRHPREEAKKPSPLTLSYPSAVQNVFSKEEEGGKTRLKWQPSRHDGRWDKNPIVRLTPEPITATEFVDENAGGPTRRYEIVAVDALGQEGEPSRPVWSRREWRRFYVPYIAKGTSEFLQAKDARGKR